MLVNGLKKGINNLNKTSLSEQKVPLKGLYENEKYVQRDRDAEIERDRRSRGLALRSLRAEEKGKFWLASEKNANTEECFELKYLQRDRDAEPERERRSRGLRLRGLRERDLKQNVHSISHYLISLVTYRIVFLILLTHDYFVIFLWILNHYHNYIHSMSKIFKI